MSGEVEQKVKPVSSPPAYFSGNDDGNGVYPDSSFNPQQQQQPFQHEQHFQPHFQQRGPFQQGPETVVLHLGQEPHPYANPSSIYGCCCSAQTWTLFAISLKIFLSLVAFGVGVRFHLSADSHNSSSHDYSYSSSDQLQTFGSYLMVAAAVSILLYGMIMWGVVQKNSCLVTFWLVLLCLELIGSVAQSFRFFFLGHSTFTVLAIVLMGWFILNAFFLYCATAFKNEITVLNSSHLQIVQTTTAAASTFRNV